MWTWLKACKKLNTNSILHQILNSKYPLEVHVLIYQETDHKTSNLTHPFKIQGLKNCQVLCETGSNFCIQLSHFFLSFKTSMSIFNVSVRNCTQKYTAVVPIQFHFCILQIITSPNPKPARYMNTGRLRIEDVLQHFSLQHTDTYYFRLANYGIFFGTATISLYSSLL